MILNRLLAYVLATLPYFLYASAAVVAGCPGCRG